MKALSNKTVFLFDWGNTIMRDFPEIKTPMCTWEQVELMPEADKMLEAINSKATCYLATNAIVSTKEEIRKALARGGVDRFFQDIFCYRELGVKKPSKEYFDELVRQLKLPKEQMLMVGDNLEGDVLGAMAAGIDAVLYDKDNEHAGYEGWRIKNLLELLALTGQ